ncbi:unnamed protein product [Dovyalis caffra]|uniref:Gnk2-homologous domain-containing protein n=1 Tax=Dovyalis caffra TaxID=77055 RepID=A0AAV1SES0_9ROSI|nr:unnamed protein product [Dovyalis caffra]
MEEIVSCCPVCCELFDNQGWNALYYAVVSKRIRVFKVSLKIPKLDRLVNGYTPIHLIHASALKHEHWENFLRSLCRIYRLNEQRLSVNHIVKKIIFSCTAAKMFRLDQEILKSIDYVDKGPFGIVVEEEKKAGSEYNKKREESLDKVREAHVVVAAFIATVTFATAFTLPGTQQFEYRYHFCTDSSTYTTNSSFPSNLNATLSSLYANATRRDGFYNTSAGQSSDKVYGLFLCRGDTSPEVCQSCIKAISEEIVNRCPNNKEAIIWYDMCMLRYSNRSIFSVSEERPKVWMWNRNNIGDVMNVDQFNASLGDLMNKLVTRAASSSNLFAMEDRNETAFIRLYGLVQCTPDISPSQCRICLAGCVSDIPRCCNGKQGGNVLAPSCNMRYEIYRFTTAPPAPPPPAIAPSLQTPPATLLNPSGERKNSSRTIVYITVPTSVFVVLFFTLCYCYVHQKARKKYNATEGANGIENVERNPSSI